MAIKRVVLLVVLLAVFASCLDVEERENERGVGSRANDGPPSEVTVDALSTTVLAVTWLPPVGFESDSDFYSVAFTCSPDPEQKDKTTISFYEINSLQPCQTCDVTVTACFSDGDTLCYPAETSNGTTDADVPPPPQQCTFTAITSTSMQIGWQPPDTFCPVSEYKLSWTWEALWAYDMDDTGSGTSVTTSYPADSLTPYSNYTFRIVAVAEKGDTDPLVCSETTEEDEHMPPYFVSTEAVSDTELNVSWTPPPTDPDYYTVTSTDGSIDEIVFYPEEFVLIDGLEACKTYEMTVAAVYGSLSAGVDTSGTTDSDVPPAPTDCSFSNIKATSMSVSWLKPEAQCPVTNNSINTTYYVLWSDEVGSLNETFSFFENLRISDLIPYTNYSFSIAGSTDAGYGPPLVCSQTTMEAKPGMVNVTEVIDEVGGVTVKWLPPDQANGIILNYTVTLAFDGKLQNFTVNGTLLETQLTGLTPCKNYSVSVKATNNVDTGDDGPPTSFVYDREVPPKAVHCGEANQTSVEVLWVPAALNCPVSQYLVMWSGDILWSDRTDNGTISVAGDLGTLSQEVDGLVPYTSYTVQVTVSKDIEGPNCTIETLQGAPSEPPVKELYTEGTSIIVSWNEPEEKNGNITGYIVTWQDLDQPNSVQNKSLNSTTFSSTIDGLDRCHDYDVSVKGDTEKGGPGEESQVIAPVTNSIWEKGLSCSGDTDSSQLEWNLAVATTECPVPQYLLDFSYTALCSGEEVSASTTIPGDKTDYTLEGLISYSKFNVCLSIDGSLERPVCCSNVTQEDVPSAPDVLNVAERSKTFLSVEWLPMECSNGKVTGWLLSCPVGDPLELEKNVTAYTCDDLSPGHTYSIHLQAINSVGYGERIETKASTLPNTGLIIGLSLGILLLVIMLAGGGYYGYQYHKRNKERKGGSKEHLSSSSTSSGDAVDGKTDKEYDSYSNEMYKMQQRTYSDQQYASERSEDRPRTSFMVEKINEDRKKSIQMENNLRDFGVLPRLNSINVQAMLDKRKSTQEHQEMIKMSEIPRNRLLQAGVGMSKVDNRRRHSVHPEMKMRSPQEFPEHYEQRPTNENRRYSLDTRLESQPVRYLHNVNRPRDRPRMSLFDAHRPGVGLRPSDRYDAMRPGRPNPYRRPSEPALGKPNPYRRPSEPALGKPNPYRRPSEPALYHSYDRN